MKSIEVVAWAWPVEVAVIVAYALGAPLFLSTVQYDQFVRTLPLLTALIGTQSAVAYFGKKQMDST